MGDKYDKQETETVDTDEVVYTIRLADAASGPLAGKWVVEAMSSKGLVFVDEIDTVVTGAAAALAARTATELTSSGMTKR